MYVMPFFLAKKSKNTWSSTSFPSLHNDATIHGRYGCPAPIGHRDFGAAAIDAPSYRIAT